MLSKQYGRKVEDVGKFQNDIHKWSKAMFPYTKKRRIQ